MMRGLWLRAAAGFFLHVMENEKGKENIRRYVYLRYQWNEWMDRMRNVNVRLFIEHSNDIAQQKKNLFCELCVIPANEYMGKVPR